MDSKLDSGYEHHMLAEPLPAKRAIELGAECSAVELQIPDKLLITFLGGKMGSRAAAVEHLVNATMPQVRCSHSAPCFSCGTRTYLLTPAVAGCPPSGGWCECRTVHDAGDAYVACGRAG